MSDRNPSAGTVLGAFLLGGALGAAIALLSAPKAGKDTRKDVSEWAQGAAGRTREKVQTWAQDTGERVRTLASQTGERAREVASGTRERLRDIADETGERIKGLGHGAEEGEPDPDQA